MNEENKIGYYAIIPATVLFNEKIKANEKLLYAIITVLSNKEGYCYASNGYLGRLLNAKPHTVSKWVSHLKELEFVCLDMIRNDKGEIIQRRIYPNDTPYTINRTYPYSIERTEGMSQKGQYNNIIDNNINNKIDRLFNLVINNNGEISNDFQNTEDFQEFYKIIERLEFNYTKDILLTFKKENIDKLKIIVYAIKELYIKNKRHLLEKSKRENFIDVYDSCKSFEKTYKNTENEIKSFYDYYYVSIIRKLEAN